MERFVQEEGEERRRRRWKGKGRRPLGTSPMPQNLQNRVVPKILELCVELLASGNNTHSFADKEIAWRTHTSHQKSPRLDRSPRLPAHLSVVVLFLFFPTDTMASNMDVDSASTNSETSIEIHPVRSFGFHLKPPKDPFHVPSPTCLSVCALCSWQLCTCRINTHG